MAERGGASSKVYWVLPQGQYWIEYLYLLLAAPPSMAAANFVVITNGGGCALTGTADIDHVVSFRELRLVVDCR